MPTDIRNPFLRRFFGRYTKFIQADDLADGAVGGDNLAAAAADSKGGVLMADFVADASAGSAAEINALRDALIASGAMASE